MKNKIKIISEYKAKKIIQSKLYKRGECPYCTGKYNNMLNKYIEPVNNSITHIYQVRRKDYYKLYFLIKS